MVCDKENYIGEETKREEEKESHAITKKQGKMSSETH